MYLYATFSAPLGSHSMYVLPVLKLRFLVNRILTPSRLYLIDMGNEGRARDSRPPAPHPPGNLFLTGKPD